MGAGCNIGVNCRIVRSTVDHRVFRGMATVVVDYKQLRLEAKEDKRNRHITEALTGRRCPCKSDVIKLLKGGIQK